MLHARWAARTQLTFNLLKKPHPNSGFSRRHTPHVWREYSTTRRPRSDKIDYNSKPEFSFASLESDSSEYVNYKLVTANELESCKEPPKRVKMLIRDFIEDSLYNPHYGYFPKQANIYTSPEDMIDFSKIRDSNEFEEIVAQRYMGYGVAADGPGKQIFHTPTELFRVSFI